MTEEREIPYPKAAMLPNVDYKKLEESGFFENILVDLEYQTMRNLSDFTEQFKKILLEKEMVQLPELMVAHLCAYLGFLTVAGLGIKQATELSPHIAKLLEKQAHYSYEQFAKYPVNSTIPDQETKKKNLGIIRELMPSSIVVQTVRLGREIFDATQELSDNRPYTHQKQTELFCPQDLFMNLLMKVVPKTIKEWEKSSMRQPTLYAINQAAIQLGWLMGYFAHLDNNPPKTHLKYGSPCVQLYIEYGNKFLALRR